MLVAVHCLNAFARHLAVCIGIAHTHRPGSMTVLTDWVGRAQEGSAVFAHRSHTR